MPSCCRCLNHFRLVWVSVFGVALFLSACGHQESVDTKLAIAGGREVKPEDFTYRSTLWITAGSFSCSGVLISPNHAITAAHCFEKNIKNPAASFAVFGANAWQSNLFRRGLRFTIHSDYSQAGRVSGRVNDIAMLYWSKPIESPFEPAKIISENDVIGDSAAVILSGYGTVDTNNRDGLLRQVMVKYNGKQVGSYEFRTMGSRLSDGTVQNSCAGDSGGPAFIEQQSQWIVAGILSRGGDCPKRGDGVYTDLRSYRTWLSCAQGLLAGTGSTAGCPAMRAIELPQPQ